MALRIQAPRVVGILGVSCVGLAAWLLFPRPATDPAERRAPVRVCLVDASGSVRRTRPDWVRWVRGALAAEAEAARSAGERFAVVSFASEVGVGFAPGDPDAFLERLRGRGGRPFDPRAVAGPDDASELAGALEVACQLGSGASQRLQRLVLLGPGTYTGAEPRPYVAQARRLGVALACRPPPPPELADLALRALELPRTIEAGAPLAGRVTLAFEPGRLPVRRAFLEVEVDNAGEVRRSVVELDLLVGPGRAGGALELPLACGPAGFGRTEVRLRARLEPGPDPVPENDVLRRATHAEGELVVGVAASAKRQQAARQWLVPSGTSALPGLQFVFVTPDELTEVLAECDALVTYDLKVRDLPSLLVEDFVLRGGGWLATAGWRFLEDWVPGEPPTGLARLLPLEPAPLERGPRDVVLLVDGSGSMEGEPFETVRAACLDLVAAALPSDEVSLRFFTAGLEEPHPIKPRTSAAKAERPGAQEAVEAGRRLLDLRVPNGETYLLRSLEHFAETRRGLERDTLVLLLTDGREREGMERPDLRAQNVLSALSERRTTLKVIAVGERASLGFLSYLTAPGEEVARPENLDELRALFRREISGAQWREGPALAVRWEVAASDSLAADVRGGAEPPALQSVERLIKNRLRPEAEALWVDAERQPVLGLQRAGLGRTALASTHPGEGWAPAWAARLGRGEPRGFAPLLRWLGRGTRRRTEGPRLARAGQALVLTGLDASWPAAVEARLVEATEPDGEELGRLRFTPPARAGAGDPLARRRAELTGPLLERLRGQQALLLVERPPTSDAPDGGVWIEPVALGPPAEYAGLERSLNPEGPEGAPAPEKPASGALEPHPRGPALLLLGLFLLTGAAVLRGRGQGIAPSDR